MVYGGRPLLGEASRAMGASPAIPTSVLFGEQIAEVRAASDLAIVRATGSTAMRKVKIPHNAFVFVGDGRKALVFRNEGDEQFPNLRTEQVLEDENPLTHEQGSEPPGRVSKAFDSGQRSAVEPVDWHQIEEQQFAKRVAAAMEQVVRARKAPALVIVAPPRTLAELRDALHADVQARVVAEVNKDLTKHPVAEIERHLTAG